MMDDALRERLRHTFDPRPLDLEQNERAIRARSRRRTRSLSLGVGICVACVAVAAGVFALHRGTTGPEVRAIDRGSATTATTATAEVPADWSGIPMDQAVFPGVAPITAIVQWRGDLYAAGNSYGSEQSYGTEPVVWKSPDGIHWTKVWANPDPCCSLSQQSFLPTDSRLLLFESHNTSGRAWESTDGLTFTPTPQPWGNPQLNGIVNSGRWVVAIVGGRGGAPTAVWTTADGGVWHRTTADLGNAELTSLIVVDGAFVMGGSDGLVGGLPSVWRSADGEHWTKEVVSLDSGAVTALAGDKDLLIAATTDGTGRQSSMWSSTGRGWRKQTIDGAAVGDVRRIFRVPLGYVAVPAEGSRLLFSSAGTTWQPTASPTDVTGIDGVLPLSDGLLLFASQSNGEGLWRVTVGRR